MNQQQATDFLHALIASVTINVIVPLLILTIVVALGWLLVSKAQNQRGFEISDVLRDEAGKVSSERLLLFATWGASTWVLAVVVFAIPNSVIEAYATYLGVWGTTNAAKTFFKAKYGDPPVKN